MKTKVYSIDGKELRTIELDDTVFNREVSNGTIYYAVNNELANRRVGTASTKTRGEVNYSNAKPYKQKGTGNARAGDKKSPIWTGGGTIFGPKPRDYSYRLPKKMKRLAMKSLLSLGVQDGRLVVVEDFTIESGKTRDLTRFSRTLSPTRAARFSSSEKMMSFCAGQRGTFLICTCSPITASVPKSCSMDASFWSSKARRRT